MKVNVGQFVTDEEGAWSEIDVVLARENLEYNGQQGCF